MNRTSISDLKAKAKDQLLGNYGIATGSFALLFVLIYTILAVIMSASGIWLKDSLAANEPMSLAQQFISQGLGMLIGVISALFSVGYVYVLFRIAREERPSLSDLFFVFKNHPDKVIIISLILTGAQFILLLPANLVGSGITGDQLLTSGGGRAFLLYIVLYLTGFVISFVIDLMLAMCFMIYIDDPDRGVGDIVKESVAMMKGNKFRYFYMILSFFGYWLLIMLSCGIAALWVVPYQTMAMVEFYFDLVNGNGAVTEQKTEYFV